ncbi:hypothetical protein CROQUDRAFT_660770 [Cronartium quercuum f. sp. fusiforme G11]|uniref:Coiled-coil domain-containing protein 130 n=1 Tax=Cronartium quercuum f. sp. fusiforme G11 TaxID=708437 RepID=A0A9P6T969_9BASI|nr:hypothetical protein CROQUDRAFT_660770 [Cronartium quercuum f. sp. fusiforme G11]
MQGFNRYYPPDFDPKTHDTLNNYHGKHALGDRARKIDQGILITRFELPFNIWCGSCEAHIGMGVRYNAEKKKVGMYYSTPIFSFRCKCHLCGNWFEIRTDPQNTRYVVVSGARQKNEEWDPAENGGIVLEPGPSDQFALVEKQTTDKQAALAAKDRLEDLYDLSESRNSDPFVLSQKLRRSFRKEKAELIAKSKSDDTLRTRYSLPANLRLDEKDEPAESERARSLISESRAEASAKRRREEAELGGAPPPKRLCGPTSALRDRLVANRRRKLDPFLSPASSSSSPRRLSPLIRPSPSTPLLCSHPKPSVGSSSAPAKAIQMLNDYASD